jgi:hypothetical protein
MLLNGCCVGFGDKIGILGAGLKGTDGDVPPIAFTSLTRLTFLAGPAENNENNHQEEVFEV